MTATVLDPALPVADAAVSLPGAPATTEPSAAYRRYVLGALSVVGFMCAVDRVVISMFVEPIKQEFGLSDTQIGLMTGVAFAVMGGIAAIPLARWADRANRKWIINGCFAVWSLMTAASGMAGSFVTMLLARVGVGIGEAGCIPSTHSMLGDYYPRELRPHALSVHSAAYYLGTLGGLAGGGLLLQAVGWRAGFLWLGAAGIVMAVVFHLTVREPARPPVHAPLVGAERAALAEGEKPSLLSQLGDLRAFGWLVMAFSTTSLAGSSLIMWLPSYFTRAFPTLLAPQIGLGLGLCIGVATAIGAVVGGRLGVRNAGAAKSWGARFAALDTVVVMPFFLGSFYAPDPLLAFAMLFCAFLTAGMILGPVFSTLQDLVSPDARATAVAVVSLCGVLLGQGCGPLVVGVLSDAFQTAAGGADSLRTAMALVGCVNFLTILAFWQLKRRIDVLSPPGA